MFRIRDSKIPVLKARLSPNKQQQQKQFFGCFVSQNNPVQVAFTGCRHFFNPILQMFPKISIFDWSLFLKIIFA
jgi:hypothetical protein